MSAEVRLHSEGCRESIRQAYVGDSDDRRKRLKTV